MVERKPSKASRAVEDFMYGGNEPRKSKLPELRLRSDMPTVAVSDKMPIADVVEQLESEGVSAIALREPSSDATTVMLTVERYLELVGKVLVGQRTGVVNSYGQFVPPESDFADAYVEQVNPKDEAWSWNERNQLP